MFAVPGWSVSSSSLKTQTLDSVNPAPIGATPAAGGNDAASKGKKRKRSGSGKSKAKDVNPTNLADMWEKVIEGKSKPKSAKHAEKRQKIAKEGEAKSAGEDAPEAQDGNISVVKEAAEGQVEPKKRKNKDKKEKRGEKKAALDESTNPQTTPSEPTTKVAPPAPKPTPTLTPLQASMRQKLISARFRHLNQTLYTTPSTHSLELFSTNPEMFDEYHEGFRRQVEVWPENPVDGYILQIKSRGKVRGPHRSNHKPKPSAPDPTSKAIAPLPRTEGTSHIADLGCGDAGLASGLQPLFKKLKLKIHSFDLQNPSPLVTKADIANLPLEDGSIDIAIFCLALMGTNWIDFIEEAFRILRWKGELWVSEIKSRFGRVSNSKSRVEHSVGNRTKNAQPAKKKAAKQKEEALDDADLAVEVDGEDRKEETDVSAFVEVLRKRGFVLQGEVDLRNRMFVKMCFVKAATPIKGKGVPVPKGMAEMGLETWKKKPKGKFIDEEVKVGSEAAVLKPCVYKLR
jgi:ribosomal RNA-processing protein 8